MVPRKLWLLENFSLFSESRQCFYRVSEARLFLFGSEIAWVSGSNFQARVSASWRVSDLTRLDSAALSGPAFVPPRKTDGRTSRQPCLRRNSKNIIYAPTIWAVDIIHSRPRESFSRYELTTLGNNMPVYLLACTEYGYRSSCDHKISFCTLSNIHTGQISCKFISFAIMRTHWTQNVLRQAHRRSQQHDRNLRRIFHWFRQRNLHWR